MKEVADVVVVGGGPAGAATAYHLATRGHTVLVCEKEVFPRVKTCGDGLTPRAVRELNEMGLAEALAGAQRVSGFRLRAARGIVELPFPRREGWPGEGLVVRRHDLDRIVLDAAEAAGATVRYGTRVLAPFVDRGVVAGVDVRTSDGGPETIRAKFVVSAEGSTGRFTRLLGRSQAAGSLMGVGLRQYVRLAGSGDWFDVYPTLRANGAMLSGYGWAFPMCDGTTNVGIGYLSHRMPKHPRLIQEAFVDRLLSESGTGGERLNGAATGGRLLLAGSVWPLHGPGYLLVGDAAGRVNPCTGEGIAYAYETARIAAAHLAAALRRKEQAALEAYTEELRSTYGPYNRLSHGIVHLVGRQTGRSLMLSAVMASRRAKSFAAVVLANLEATESETPEDRLFRAAKRLAGLLP